MGMGTLLSQHRGHLAEPARLLHFSTQLDDYELIESRDLLGAAPRVGLPATAYPCRAEAPTPSAWVCMAFQGWQWASTKVTGCILHSIYISLDYKGLHRWASPHRCRCEAVFLGAQHQQHLHVACNQSGLGLSTRSSLITL